MDTIREFMVSSSGLAPARQGLGLGWMITALMGVAILLGAKEIKADDDDEEDKEDCSGLTGSVTCSVDPTECTDSTRPWYCRDNYGNDCCTT